VRPVYDLGKLLGSPSAGAPVGNYAVLLRAKGREIAVVVGDLQEVRKTGSGRRGPAPAGSAHTRWTTQDLIPVLDVAAMMQEES
jgi:hypothetical protein